jgi:predicted nucleotidyltransferase
MYDPFVIAQDIARDFSLINTVESIALGGSLVTGKATGESDIDIYVYSMKPIRVETRSKIIQARSSVVELDALFWETEDYWIEKESDIKVEVIYRDDWPLKTLQDMFENNRAHMGFSTSIWHNIATCKILFDRNEWLVSVKEIANQPYPDSLAKAIIHKNFVLLKGSLAAHPRQLDLAIKRNDVAHIISLVNMILNSYFDILFALNHTLHPGAKRQLEYAEALILKPEGMSRHINALMTHDGLQIRNTVRELIDDLEVLLKNQGTIQT